MSPVERSANVNVGTSAKLLRVERGLRGHRVEDRILVGATDHTEHEPRQHERPVGGAEVDLGGAWRRRGGVRLGRDGHAIVVGRCGRRGRRGRSDRRGRRGRWSRRRRPGLGDRLGGVAGQLLVRGIRRGMPPAGVGAGFFGVLAGFFGVLAGFFAGFFFSVFGAAGFGGAATAFAVVVTIKSEAASRATARAAARLDGRATRARRARRPMPIRDGRSSAPSLATSQPAPIGASALYASQIPRRRPR